RLELSETIQAELLENPLLEESQEVSELDQKKAEIEKLDSSTDLREVAPEKNKDPDFDWDAYLEHSFSYTGKCSRGLGYDPNQEDGPGFEAMTTNKESLADHLLAQLAISDLDEHETKIAEALIASLDEWGYLRDRIEEIAKRLNEKPETVEFV